MPVTSRDVPLSSGGAEWVKTPRGWKLRSLQDFDYTPTCERINPRRNLSNISKDISLARNVLVAGTKGQRKVSVCLSEFLKYMDIEGAVTDIRRKTYLFDMMQIFMTDHLPKVSGTAHRELFKILEKLCNEAIETQLYINQMRALLQCTLNTLFNPGANRIGSKSVWNKHIQTVSNLQTKLDQFSFNKREDDDHPHLTDLPKECIRDIIFRLSDHRDIVHLGQTCSDMYEMCQDDYLWERLTQHHFTEKQMLTFIHDTQDIDESLPWQQLYRKCYKKYGLKKSYTDGLVICSACKTLHWMLIGHACWSSSDNALTAYLDPVTPQELMLMLNL